MCETFIRFIKREPISVQGLKCRINQLDQQLAIDRRLKICHSFSVDKAINIRIYLNGSRHAHGRWRHSERRKRQHTGLELWWCDVMVCESVRECTKVHSRRCAARLVSHYRGQARMLRQEVTFRLAPRLGCTIFNCTYTQGAPRERRGVGKRTFCKTCTERVGGECMRPGATGGVLEGKKLHASLRRMHCVGMQFSLRCIVQCAKCERQSANYVNSNTENLQI